MCQAAGATFPRKGTKPQIKAVPSLLSGSLCSAVKPPRDPCHPRARPAGPGPDMSCRDHERGCEPQGSLSCLLTPTVLNRQLASFFTALMLHGLSLSGANRKQSKHQFWLETCHTESSYFPGSQVPTQQEIWARH